VTGLELAHASTDTAGRRRNVHLLAQRRVEHSVLAEPIGEPRGAAEDAAEAHVLSEDISTAETKKSSSIQRASQIISRISAKLKIRLHPMGI
jgi:hypothetical protein